MDRSLFDVIPETMTVPKLKIPKKRKLDVDQEAENRLAAPAPVATPSSKVAEEDFEPVGEIRDTVPVEPVYNEVKDAFLRSFHDYKYARCVTVENVHVIVNEFLEQRFLNAKKRLKHSGQSEAETFGYINVGFDERELQEVVNYGYECASAFVCEFGDVGSGVPVYRNGDLTTAAVPMKDTLTRVLVFKTLRGNVCNVEFNSADRQPTKGYSSHMHRNTTTTSSRLFNHRQSAVYHYSFGEDGQIELMPSTVLPYAMITFKWNAVDELSRLSSFRCEFPLVEVGAVSMQIGDEVTPDHFFSDLRVKSPFTDFIKPGGMYSDEPIFCESYFHYDDLFNDETIGNMLNEKNWGQLLELAEIEYRDENDKRKSVFASYTVLTSPEGKFADLVHEMRFNKVALVGVTSQLRAVFLIPSGEFASSFGFPWLKEPALHAIAMKRSSMYHADESDYDSILVRMTESLSANWSMPNVDEIWKVFESGHDESDRSFGVRAPEPEQANDGRNGPKPPSPTLVTPQLAKTAPPPPPPPPPPPTTSSVPSSSRSADSSVSSTPADNQNDSRSSSPIVPRSPIVLLDPPAKGILRKGNALANFGQNRSVQRLLANKRGEQERHIRWGREVRDNEGKTQSKQEYHQTEVREFTTSKVNAAKEDVETAPPQPTSVKMTEKEKAENQKKNTNAFKGVFSTIISGLSTSASDETIDTPELPPLDLPLSGAPKRAGGPEEAASSNVGVPPKKNRFSALSLPMPNVGRKPVEKDEREYSPTRCHTQPKKDEAINNKSEPAPPPPSVERSAPRGVHEDALICNDNMEIDSDDDEGHAMVITASPEPNASEQPDEAMEVTTEKLEEPEMKPEPEEENDPDDIDYDKLFESANEDEPKKTEPMKNSDVMKTETVVAETKPDHEGSASRSPDDNEEPQSIDSLLANIRKSSEETQRPAVLPPNQFEWLRLVLDKTKGKSSEQAAPPVSEQTSAQPATGDFESPASPPNHGYGTEDVDLRIKTPIVPSSSSNTPRRSRFDQKPPELKAPESKSIPPPTLLQTSAGDIDMRLLNTLAPTPTIPVNQPVGFAIRKAPPPSNLPAAAPVFGADDDEETPQEILTSRGRIIRVNKDVDLRSQPVPPPSAIPLPPAPAPLPDGEKLRKENSLLRAAQQRLKESAILEKEAGAAQAPRMIPTASLEPVVSSTYTPQIATLPQAVVHPVQPTKPAMAPVHALTAQLTSLFNLNPAVITQLADFDQRRMSQESNPQTTSVSAQDAPASPEAPASPGGPASPGAPASPLNESNEDFDFRSMAPKEIPVVTLEDEDNDDDDDCVVVAMPSTSAVGSTPVLGGGVVSQEPGRFHSMKVHHHSNPIDYDGAKSNGVSEMSSWERAVAQKANRKSHDETEDGEIQSDEEDEVQVRASPVAPPPWAQQQQAHPANNRPFNGNGHPPGVTMEQPMIPMNGPVPPRNGPMYPIGGPLPGSHAPPGYTPQQQFPLGRGRGAMMGPPPGGFGFNSFGGMRGGRGGFHGRGGMMNGGMYPTHHPMAPMMHQQHAPMAVYTVIVPDKMIFNRIVTPPEAFEALCMKLKAARTMSSDHTIIHIHKHMKDTIEEKMTSLANTAQGQTFKLFNSIIQRYDGEVIRLMPEHNCDSAEQNSLATEECFKVFTIAQKSSQRFIYMTNMSPQSDLGKKLQAMSVDVKSPSVIMQMYGIDIARFASS